MTIERQDRMQGQRTPRSHSFQGRSRRDGILAQINQIEELQYRIQKRLPAVDARLDPPMKLENPWWLDLALQGHSVVVEWRPGQGFGLSTGESGYGEGPDEVYSRAEEAEARLIELLEERKETKPPKFY